MRALNRTRRGEIDVLARVLDVHYPEQVEPTTLHGGAALYRLRVAPLLVPGRQPRALSAVRPALPARGRDAVGSQRGSRASCTTTSRARSAGRRSLGPTLPAPPFDRARAIALLEEAGYRDSDADGVRDNGGKPIRLTMLEPAGNKLFNVEARAFVLEMRKAGILVDLVPTDAATILQRLKRGEFDLAPMTWQGAPDEVPAALFGSDGAFNYGGYRSGALDALLDEARARRRTGGARARSSRASRGC